MASTLVRDVDKKGRYNAYNGSSGELEQAVKIDPADPGVWWRLCTSYETVKKWDLALGACQKEVELNTDENSLADLSGVYMHRHEYFQAARVLELGESPPNGYPILIQALLASGQYEKALPVAQRLVELNEHGADELPSGLLPDVLRELAFTYQQLGQQKKAQETFERLQKLDQTLHYHSCEMKPDSLTDIPVVRCS